MPQEPFNFSNPSDPPKWIKSFEHFRAAPGLIEKGGNVQVNTLYLLNKFFGLSEEESKNLQCDEGKVQFTLCEKLE